ncbi:hypothetical protein [Streptomyces sp. NPDC053755]|uniref:hypothetical protein n=1 Tax=Streptomyces sp. NPDC053755 TaxID=3155815 RepID=UPI0034372E82
MGTREYAAVVVARNRLGARAGTGDSPSPQFTSGAAAAYRWALGGAERSPVTGSGSAEGGPGLPALTAEVDAAVVQMEDPTSAAGPRDYHRGVHDALAWVCGHRNEAP